MKQQYLQLYAFSKHLKSTEKHRSKCLETSRTPPPASACMGFWVHILFQKRHQWVSKLFVPNANVSNFVMYRPNALFLITFVLLCFSFKKPIECRTSRCVPGHANGGRLDFSRSARGSLCCHHYRHWAGVAEEREC